MTTLGITLDQGVGRAVVTTDVPGCRETVVDGENGFLVAARDPKARKWAGGMPGGQDNPLGARAHYLYKGNVDTLYRIHGTVEPWTIGKSVSSGCIRMINQDAIDLYNRTAEGTRVVVLGSGGAVG